MRFENARGLGADAQNCESKRLRACDHRIQVDVFVGE
jgi:hypothetical protein